MKSELHLFIVWSKAIDSYDNIISDLKIKFDILDVYLVKWNKHLFSSNLSRFYGANLPNGSHKEKHCGRDEFILIIIRDPYPVYDYRVTTIGKEKVNAKVFDSKVAYRDMTGGGHKIHATNSLEETSHDLMLLLEKRLPIMQLKAYLNGMVR